MKKNLNISIQLIDNTIEDHVGCIASYQHESCEYYTIKGDKVCDCGNVDARCL